MLESNSVFQVRNLSTGKTHEMTVNPLHTIRPHSSLGNQTPVEFAKNSSLARQG